MACIDAKSRTTLEEELKKYNSVEQDTIYRILWLEFVKEDIKNYAEGNDIELSDDTIEYLAELYVFEGKYDCNMSYWVNIENLIENNTARI